MKLSKKQKEVIQFMRTGKELYISGGFDNSAGFSGGGMEISLATYWKIQKLGLLSEGRKPNSSLMTYYSLSELGKTISI